MRKNFFTKTYKFKAYDLGLLKIAMVAFGLWLGSNWPSFFVAWEQALAALFVLTVIYLAAMYWKQIF